MPETFNSENQPVPKTTPEMSRLLGYLKDEFARFDIDYQRRSKAWGDWHKQFRGVMEKFNAEVTKSRLYINRTKVSVFSGLANILDVLFPGQDFFDVVGRTDADEKGSELAKQVMDWMLQAGDYLPEAEKYVLQAAIYGTSFGKIVKHDVTDVVIEKLPQIHPLLGITTGYKTKEVKKTLSFSVFESIDIFQMRIDPLATSIENASGLFHEVRRNIHYLRMMQERGIYKHIDDVEELVYKAQRNQYDKRRKNVGLPDEKLPKEEVKLYEYWGKIPKDIAKEAGIEVKPGEYEVESIVTLANMAVIIRAERNTNPAQERMFVSDVWESSGDNSIYGRGIPENVRGPQLALNSTVNIRLDNKAWAIAAPIIINIDKIEDVDDLIARPNWYIRTHGAPNDVAQFASIPDLTSTTVQEAQEFERYIDDESGMNKVVQATQGFGSNRTAAGISLAFSAASRPVRMIARGFEQNLIAKGLKKLFMLFVTNMDKELVIRVTNDPLAPQFINVDPFSLALDVDFIPSGSFALTMRESMLESMMQFVDSASKIPPVAQSLNWRYIAEKVYQAMGLKDFDKVWIGSPTGQVPMMEGQGGQGTQGQASPTPGGTTQPGGMGAGGGMVGGTGGLMQ